MRITGGTVIARIISIWLLVLFLSFLLLFAGGVLLGGSDGDASLEAFVFIIFLQSSLILSIVIYFAREYWINQSRNKYKKTSKVENG